MNDEKTLVPSVVSPMTIILGGVVYEAALRDGSKQEVKVLQLAIDFIDQWAALQGDEAGLVELYCDQRDLVTPQRLRILHTQELRLLELIGTSDPDKFDELEGRLSVLREKIDALKKVERWDSKLLPESHNEILRIGEELNRPIFDRWAADRLLAIGQMKKSNELLQSSLSATSSSTVPASSE